MSQVRPSRLPASATMDRAGMSIAGLRLEYPARRPLAA
jgi:hypothetical protein